MRWLAVLCVSLLACSEDRDPPAVCAGDCATKIHAAGILDPASDEFHGKLLARIDWSFATCARCHGEDFSGGAAKVSCLSCHKDGPTACTTCHGEGPTSNAHVVHRGRGVTCAACHTVPAKWDDDGHLLHDGVAIPGPARVTFGALAATTVDPADRAGPPSWDGATCRNVYCHGAAMPAGGTVTAPRWDDPATGGCDRCHGNPPPSHVRNDCASCHPASAPHVDGVVQIGRTPGCDGCHGSPASPAPPTDLAGNTATTALGVGAHQAHLRGASRISAPIACATCHLVPAALDSPGHIDQPGPAPVTPALGWDRGVETCATAWCHGAARPHWTTTGEVSCGSCHGIPPASAPHSPTMKLTDCASCHPGTVDAFGNILVDGTSSEHINGIVDHL